ncbi:MAG: class I SAM-dependent methyltransferase [candidate division WOR-3 bacterium]|nr:MAG: class I SAM-dependent methyltransferase [candidate division WOR-3 bacterium]
MKNRTREFYEELGEKYPEDSIVYSTLSGRIRKKWIVDSLRGFPRGNLLDCGCNVGTLSRGWQKGVVFGVDISYAVLKKGKTLSPKASYLQADLCEMIMLRKNSIDNAIACEVIEHLEAADRFLDNLYLVMKKGGLLLITSPNYTSVRPGRIPLGILRSFGIEYGTRGKEYLHTAYKPTELAALALRSGFTIQEKGTFEKELRGWLKPATIFRRCLETLCLRLAPASRMLQLLEQGFNSLEINTFDMLNTFNFGVILRRIFSEGRRSYIIARK